MTLVRRIATCALVVALLMTLCMPALAAGRKSGEITGAGIAHTGTFTLSTAASRCLTTGINVMLEAGASFRTVSLTTTLQMKRADGSYSNVRYFSCTVQKSGISNTSGSPKYFPGPNSYTYLSTDRMMLHSGTFRYREFARSTVSDNKYTTSYKSSLN
jgi:hypothetical protein